MTGQEDSPARRYKEIVARVNQAAADLHERDRQRAVGIRARLIELAEKLHKADTDAAVTEAVIQLRWERAMELLWAEHWMRLRPQPGPDPFVKPEHLEVLNHEVERRADELTVAVRKRWYRSGKS